MKPQPAVLGAPRLPKTPTYLYTIHPKPSLLGTKKPWMSSNPSRPNSPMLKSLLSNLSAKTREQPASWASFQRGGYLHQGHGDPESEALPRTPGHLQPELLGSGSSAQVRAGSPHVCSSDFLCPGSVFKTTAQTLFPQRVRVWGLPYPFPTPDAS